MRIITLLAVLTFPFFVVAQNKSHFKKVVWIVFENANYSTVINQKDFNRFSKFGLSFNKMIAETHPSQGNYISMIAGSNLGVTDDNNYDLNQNHIGDLLESTGRDWRVYAEDYPGNCFTGATSKKYARKHVPFLSFTNVTRNQNRCKKIENSKNFFTDLANNNLPEFTMFIPNLMSDGHDSGVEYAGSWLTKNFSPILSKPDTYPDTLFIITFDESSKSQINQIYTVLIGNQILAGSTNNQILNHISLLKMIEDEFKLGNLGREDAKASQILNIWK